MADSANREHLTAFVFFSPPPPPSPQVFVRVSPRIPLHVLSHTFGCLPHPRLVYGTSKTWSLSAFLQSDALPMKLRILLFPLDQSVFVVKWAWLVLLLVVALPLDSSGCFGDVGIAPPHGQRATRAPLFTSQV